MDHLLDRQAVERLDPLFLEVWSIVSLIVPNDGVDATEYKYSEAAKLSEASRVFNVSDGMFLIQLRYSEKFPRQFELKLFKNDYATLHMDSWLVMTFWTFLMQPFGGARIDMLHAVESYADEIAAMVELGNGL